MDNKNINNMNDNLENISADLQDYEKEIPDKKSFLANLLDKFKFGKNQKLLHSGEHTKTPITNRSISSLWGFGDFRASIFNALDYVRKSISEKFSSEPPRNKLAVEVIRENNLSNEQPIKATNTPEISISPIIPPTQSSKNIINNARTSNQFHSIEVTSIDTSGITEQKENNKKGLSSSLKSTPSSNIHSEEIKPHDLGDR